MCESAKPSSDKVYWPSKACPRAASDPGRGEACVYLLPRSQIHHQQQQQQQQGESGGGGGGVKEANEWPVQNVVCSVPLAPDHGNSGETVYNYTVTMEARFPRGDSQDQQAGPSFIQPPQQPSPATAGHVHKPRAFNMVIRTPASLHNHLPVPITFDISVGLF